MNIFNNSVLRKTGFILSALIGFLAALSYAFSVSLKYQKENFETDARNTAAIVRSALDVVDGVATSLRALQGSGSDTIRSDSYAKTVISNYSFVSGFGRFEKIAGHEGAGFDAQKASVDNLVANSIWWHDEQGNRVTAGVNTTLGVSNGNVSSRFPVTLFRSKESLPLNGEQNTIQQPGLEVLKGYDFGSVDAVRAAVLKASDSGGTVLVKAPRYWPTPNSVLAIRSSYQGNDLPKVFKERRDSLDGGYWLELDIDGLGKLDGLLNDMGLELSIIEEVSEFSFASSGNDTLYSRPAQKSGYLFADWFRSNEWLKTFSVGEQTFTILLSQERGLTAVSLLTSIAGTLLFLTLLCIVVYLNTKRRNALKKQQQQSERLYQEQHRAAVTLSSIGDAVLTVDVGNSVQYSNAAAAKLLDINGEKVIGVPVSSVVRLVDESNESLASPFTAIGSCSTEEIFSSDQNLVRMDGHSMAVNLTVSPLLDISGQRNGSVIVLRDISAEKELTLQLEHQVNHDTLTGLANRYLFEKSLEELFEQSPGDANHALCIIDLDRFKQINDTCGHAAGDQLLIELAVALQRKIRAEDLLARLGGDEFGVIIKNCDESSANSVAQRIHRFFKAYHFEFDDQVFPVRSSIGLVHFKPVEFSLEDVASAADAACYMAKKNGRNSVHIQSMHDVRGADTVSEQLWMPRIKDALDNNRFALYIQPICSSAAKGKIRARHHELLIRMVGADGSLTYPVEFLKPAERYELMTSIDRWVINDALQLIAQLPDSMRQDLFSLNLSAASVKDESLADFIQQKLTTSGVSATQLCFEIDEDVFLNNIESANILLRRLRKLGCCFALDDFGAGVSSFTALKGLPVKFLKIDGQFVSGMANFAVDENMVRSLHGLARSMGLLSIAEKVENRSALALLESIGVDYVQGFAIATPVPFEDYLFAERIAA